VAAHFDRCRVKEKRKEKIQNRSRNDNSEGQAPNTILQTRQPYSLCHFVATSTQTVKERCLNVVVFNPHLTAPAGSIPPSHSLPDPSQYKGQLVPRFPERRVLRASPRYFSPPHRGASPRPSAPWQ